MKTIVANVASSLLCAQLRSHDICWLLNCRGTHNRLQRMLRYISANCNVMKTPRATIACVRPSRRVAAAVTSEATGFAEPLTENPCLMRGACIVQCYAVFVFQRTRFIVLLARMLQGVAIGTLATNSSVRSDVTLCKPICNC